MISMNTALLTVAPLETEAGSKFYKQFFDDLGSDNPYYSLELLKSHEPNQQLLCFYFSSDDGMKLALMPFHLRKIILYGEDTGYYDISSPWGYNGPLFGKDVDEAVQMEFWMAVDQWYRENKVVSEFVRFNLDGNYKHYNGTALHTLYNVKGDLRDWDVFWGNLKSNTRNQFRKAEKEGLLFEQHHLNVPLEKIKDFYQLYIGTMDRREADNSFYHDLSYFVDFCANNPHKVAVGLVYKGDVPVSGEFFLLSKDTMFSYLGGTNADYFKLRPNEYLKIKAVQWAKESGLHYYMIGGGRSDGDNLYLYKKKYFPFDEDIAFYTGRKVINDEVYAELIFRNDASAVKNEIATGYFPQYRE
jgi:hypothetical protein